MTERPVPFLATARAKYRHYSRHILGFRHFSEFRDGLKPVQRRAVWAAHELGATSRKRMVKTARVVGHAHGLYHPHAEGAIAGALSNLCQESTLAPLVIGVGNWGSHDDEPASTRYTSCYLSPYALSMLNADELACVPMDKNYDGTCVEPRFLPARLPHLLLAGCVSIASGFSGNVPPCPADWVLEAVSETLAGRRPRAPRSMAYRWGGRLLSLEGDWIGGGVAAARFAPTWRVEGSNLVFVTLAPGLGINQLAARLEKFDGFAGLVEESPAPGDLVRVVARTARDASVRDLAEFVTERCTSGERYSFLDISQRADEHGDVTYDPVIGGAASFLKRWVTCRLGIVTAAARHRAAILRVEARRLELIERAVDLRRQLIGLLDSARDPAELRAKTQRMMRCGDDEVSMVLALAGPGRGFMERADLRAGRSDCLGRAAREDALARRPGPRLLEDAESTARSLAAAGEEIARMPRVPKRAHRGKISTRKGSEEED